MRKKVVEMQERIYKIDGPKYWDTAKACYISEQEAFSSSLGVTLLRTAEGHSDEQYLYETLKFYGYPLGELATPADKIDAIIKENNGYLISMLMMSILDIEIPEQALAHFNEIKRELKTFKSEAVAKFLQEKE